MANQDMEKPIRVGVFNTVAQAERAVNGLLAAGFTKDEISVICSSDVKESLFADFRNPPLLKDQLPAAAATGLTLGALVGGLTVLAGVATTGGLGIAALGPILLGAGGGAVSGGLIGAMTTRGFTREVADYYDQAVTEGKILVAVEDHGDYQHYRLARAEKVLHDAGAEPVPLVEDQYAPG
jgi:hypothetical protein